VIKGESMGISELGVANIRCAYLKLHSLLEYMTDIGDKIGVFTYGPAIAQLYYQARLHSLTLETLNDVKIL
jgi:3-hydroxy-3-methylglutaryl CoA synthase